MQTKKAFLFILILGLVIGSVLTAFLGYFFLPDYKMTSMTPEESEFARWCYLIVGVSSSMMAATAATIWLVASFKFGVFPKPTIVEIITAVAVVVLWSIIIMGPAWSAFRRLHSVHYG